MFCILQPPNLEGWGHTASTPTTSFPPSPDVSGSLRVAYDALAPYFKRRAWDSACCEGGLEMIFVQFG